MSNKWYIENGNQGDIVLSSRVRLARNLSDYPFPCRLSADAMEAVNQTVRDALADIDGIQLRYIKMADLTANRVISLAERHLISPAFAEIAPGKALLLSDDEAVSIMLCEEDHVRIQSMYAGFAPDEAHAVADKIDDHLDKKVKYAFDERLGYLTQHPTNLGTAMRASVLLHLPALSQNFEISRLAATVSKLGLKISGAFDEGHSAKGDIYRLSNQVTFGISERGAIENLKSITLQLATRERAAREELQQNVNFMDKIHRAYGIQTSARMVTSEEMNEMLSYIRLGGIFGVLPVRTETVNELSATLQPATMNADIDENMDAPTRDARRAEIIRKKLEEDSKI